MVRQVYSIRDSKSGVYNPPFQSLTHGEAERTFHGLANDPQMTICKYAEDFDLYHLGTFDDVDGKFEQLPAPQHIVKAVQLKS